MGGILPSLETYTQLQIDSGRQGGFSFYASRMELFHGQLHVLLGGPGESGQIQSMHSPNDPFFYSHHSHIDWLWFNAQASWINQGRGPEYQIGGLDDRNMTCTLNNRLAGFQSVFADVLDLRRMCVRYLLPGQSAGAQPGGVVPGGVVPGGVVPGGVIPGGLPPGGGLPEQRRSLVPVPSGGTVSLNSAAISPNSIGGGAPYGEQLVPYQFPSGYRKMDQCPQALPQWWLARNFRNPDASSLCESIRARCEELRAQIASGQQIAPYTIMNDSVDRIPITSIIDINAPRAAPMDVPLQPRVDPGYFAHDGPIYSAAQPVLLSPNTWKIGWAFAPLVAGILALVL
ncbi:hypothetical protein BASA50_004528 [Batrachochytrium salamandrivorans]|uniref:Tyrosinase copper-binding domain-containing protein n=1 Tax=Batrachochytrium salamandrivorans TaxID=1357716 RepID=A0ABQ8FGP8_9FUNG|nr:hypothetical protein BASA50_004528 [Batrachochytrium salamandrivorans]